MFSDNTPIYEFRGPFGVPIQIGASIVFLFLVFVSFNSGPTVLAYDLLFLALLIGSIFLHELGHAWGCIVQNVPVTRIMLHGGGGFCERSRSTTRYESELIVAMGPIVNLTIWAVASLAQPMVSGEVLSYAVSTLAYINLFLALFNLLPVHPLDGGKLFQLALMRVFNPVWATKISGGVGLLIAILWIPMMLMSYWTIGLVLFFMPPIRAHWQMLRGVA